MADRVHHDDLPDTLLRKALTFAVKVAAGNSRRTSTVTVPAAMRPYLKAQKLGPAALRTVRAAVESDELFRAAVADRATADHVDEIGRLWLARPDGWADRVAELVHEHEASAAAATAVGVAAAAEARRREAAERKRAAVEQQLADARAKVAALAAQADELSAERDRLAEQVRSLEQQLQEERAANRKHRTKTPVADDRPKVDAAEMEQLRVRLKEAEDARDRALAVHAHESDAVDLDELRALLARAAKLVAPAAEARASRVPMAVPGGLHGDDVAVAEHFLRASGVEVLIDGYNVSKQVWPQLDLPHQRDQVIGMCDRLAARFGARFTVVFDGQNLTGAHAKGHRFVKVVFTDTGELADDRLRSMVRSLDPDVKVVVVTSDVAVRTSVKKMGANVLKNHVLPDLDRR